MAQYGRVMDVDTYKQELYNANRDYNSRRTWAGLQTNLLLNTESAQAALTKDYSTAMNQAYSASKVAQREIAGSGILGQEKQLLQQQNEQALNEAYNTYMSNYAQGQQAIAEQYLQGVEDIDTALTEQAENTIAYQKSHEDYLEYLWYQYQMGNNTLFDSAQWNKYLVNELDPETGEALVDDEGNQIKRLKTRDELHEASFEEVDGKKEWTSLFDDEGNLTIAGIDFYDQLSNMAPSSMLGDSATFGKFLAETDVDFLMNNYGYTKTEAEKIAEQNSELLEWSQSYNPYNYTEQGTNKGTFRTMVGMASTDEVYSFAERFGGLSTSQIDSLFTEYNDASQALDKKMSKAKDKGHSITKEVQGLVDSAHQLAIDLGIDADLEEYGLNWTQLENEALAYHSGTRTSGEMTGTWFGMFGSSTVGGLAAGTAIGASIGTGAGPIGTVIGTFAGAVIGTVIGAIVGIGVGSSEVDKQRKRNKEMAQNSQKLFNDMLLSMTQYSAAKKRQAEIDFRLQNV